MAPQWHSLQLQSCNISCLCSAAATMAGRLACATLLALALLVGRAEAAAGLPMVGRAAMEPHRTQNAGRLDGLVASSCQSNSCLGSWTTQEPGNNGRRLLAKRNKPTTDGAAAPAAEAAAATNCCSQLPAGFNRTLPVVVVNLQAGAVPRQPCLADPSAAPASSRAGRRRHCSCRYRRRLLPLAGRPLQLHPQAPDRDGGEAQDPHHRLHLWRP